MLEARVERYTLPAMIEILGTVLAGLLGLVFGSFLNVCATRWPKDESIVEPGSHCRRCGRALEFWENIPLFSWLALRGRCRTCNASIGGRYPLVEFSVAALWAVSAWLTLPWIFDLHAPGLAYLAWENLIDGFGRIIFLWLLVALAVTDVEYLWLPDRLIWPGIVLGLALNVGRETVHSFLGLHGDFDVWKHQAAFAVATWFLGAVIPAGGLFLIRILYLVVRRKEGIGMGDIKLMAMIGGWLGVRLAVFSFAIAVFIGVCAALILLMRRSKPAKDEPPWSAKPLPFGTFLCVGATVCAFWSVPLVNAYQRWFGGIGS
jgi:leader peptidase (prepilin peptidase) / N-methyltransferase